MPETSPKVITCSLAIPSRNEIEAKWPGVSWPARFYLVVDLLDGRLVDLYPANNRCVFPIDLDGEGIGAMIEPVVVVDRDGDGSERVTLDGRGSRPRESITRYSWQLNGVPIGEGPALDRIERVIPVGSHTASLTVIDGQGRTDTTTAKVVVHPGEPEPPTGPGGSGTSQPVGPIDPNELIGPGGYGPENYLPDDTSLPYRINFENDEDASAPAQVVELASSSFSKLIR